LPVWDQNQLTWVCYYIQLLGAPGHPALSPEQDSAI
jgi:hypothetical protein